MRCFIEDPPPGETVTRETVFRPCLHEAIYWRVGFENAFRKAKPVCSEHVGRFTGREGWVVRHATDFERWKQTPAEWVEEIQRVCKAVEVAFPDQAKSIFPTMRGGSDHYSFLRWGMYVGVEADGYIHT